MRYAILSYPHGALRWASFGLVCALFLFAPACDSSSKEGAPRPDGTAQQDSGNAPEPVTKEPAPPLTGVYTYPSQAPNKLQLRVPGQAAPTLDPKLLVLTYAGGGGDQYIRKISFDAQGRIIAEGAGFRVLYNLDGTGGTIDGDPDTNDDKKYDIRPRLPGNPGRAYEDVGTGLTFRVGYRQAGNLQMPIFRAFQGETRIWALWGHSVNDAQDLKVTADSRCYQAWAMPEGRIGVQCWTDGGNSVLAKAPRDLRVQGFNPDWAQGAYQRSAGGMSSMYALVEPTAGGSVLSGTFVASHVAPLAVDAWGRVYIARTGGSRSGGGDPTNPFGQSAQASSGVLALSATLKDAIFHARVGGTNCQGGTQAFGVAAIRDNLLILGGTTCADDLSTQQAAQAQHGGGQDAMLAIIQLWDP